MIPTQQEYKLRSGNESNEQGDEQGDRVDDKMGR